MRRFIDGTTGTLYLANLEIGPGLKEDDLYGSVFRKDRPYVYNASTISSRIGPGSCTLDYYVSGDLLCAHFNPRGITDPRDYEQLIAQLEIDMGDPPPVREPFSQMSECEKWVTSTSSAIWHRDWGGVSVYMGHLCVLTIGVHWGQGFPSIGQSRFKRR